MPLLIVTVIHEYYTLSAPLSLLCMAISGLKMADLISHSAGRLGSQRRRYQLWQLAGQSTAHIGSSNKTGIIHCPGNNRERDVLQTNKYIHSARLPYRTMGWWNGCLMPLFVLQAVFTHLAMHWLGWCGDWEGGLCSPSLQKNKTSIFSDHLPCISFF